MEGGGGEERDVGEEKRIGKRMGEVRRGRGGGEVGEEKGEEGGSVKDEKPNIELTNEQ